MSIDYTAPEVENLKRSFPSGNAYKTRACEVGAVQNAHFTVAPGVFRWTRVRLGCPGDISGAQWLELGLFWKNLTNR